LRFQQTHHPHAEDGAAPVDGATLLWCDVLRQVGWETEDCLDRALRRLDSLAPAGRPQASEMADVRVLLMQLQDLAATSVAVASVAEGSLYGLTRRVALPVVIQDMLAARGADFRRLRRSCIRRLAAIDVIADEALLRQLLTAVILWSLQRTASDVELVLEPAADKRGRLLCRFRHRTEMRRHSRFGGPAHWGASWQLVCQAARALGWPLRSGEERDVSWLSLEFDCIASPCLPAMEAKELTDAEGDHVLTQLFPAAEAPR
jgi:hypothetical protein